MRKRLATIIIGAALVLTMCVTAFADETYTGVWDTPIDMEEEIQFIRNTYNFTRTYMNGYETYDTAENIPDMSDKIYYHGDYMVLRVMSEPGFVIESYETDPALGKPHSLINSLNDIIFLFGTDEVGNEYRLYMKDGVIIRYIGPDGSVHDYPYGLSPWDLESTCGAFAKKMLDTVNPGWWGID